jgi:putative solute:sodium symporter small subunit
MEKSKAAKGRYWKAQLKCVGVLLAIWFIVSFGCAILFREWFDANFPNVGSAPFGFWMAQQGSIICFVLILIAYAVWMGRIEDKFEHEEGAE